MLLFATRLKATLGLLALLAAVAAAPAHAQSEFKLLANDGAQGDNFGYSVAISGDYAVVGASHDDDQGSSTGSAYVFRRSGSTWTQQVKLAPSDAAAGYFFGRSVAIDGDYAVVGAHRAQSIFGDVIGAAYVFRRSGSTWTQQRKFIASNDASAFGDDFGWSVAINGDYVIIGQPGDDDNGGQSGAAYVFRRSGSTWALQVKLTPSDAAANYYFGESVAINGDYAVVGTTANSAYVFRREGTSWIEEQKLTASDGAADDFFGSSVSLDGDYAVVGAQGDDDNGTNSGSAYVFRRSGSTWTQQVKLAPSDAAAHYNFGWSVSIDGDYALVGTSNANSAYVFRRGGTSWTEEAKLTASDGGGSFGQSVSINGSSSTIGAPGHNVDGEIRGAAYVFQVGPTLEPSATTISIEAPPGGIASETLLVTNPGTAPLSVSGVTSTDDTFSASPTSLTLAPGESETVTVTFSPPDVGTYSGELVFTHNGPTSPDAVALAGTGVATGLALSPSSLNFGEVDTGVTSSQNLQLTRDGPASEITVTDVYASDPAFDADVETPFTVTSAVNVPVTFTPQVGRPYEGYVYFAHDGTTGIDSVAVSGTGEYNARLTELATYTVATNFVNVFFRATDPSGRGLNIPGDVIDQNVDLFRVRDDGTEISPTAPETFYQVLKFDEVPYRLRTVLLLDNSTSVGNDLPEIRDAARAIVDNLAPSQEVALYVFDSQVTLLQDFTSDPALLHAAIDGIDVGSPSTALYNGLLTGLDRWEDLFELTDHGEGNVEVDIERGFLVLLSDGEDTAGGATLGDVLDARGDKRVYAVGYGDVNGSVLNQVGNAGVYSVDTADDLPAAFAEVQAEIENDAQSFYLLNYSSPRRSDQTWSLEICLRDNAYTGPGACAETSYTSTGFTDPIRGVFVNRSIESLYGVEEVEVHEGGTVLTATTILGLNEPEYEWSSSDASQVTVEAIAGTNQAIATRVGSAGGTATITLVDTANNLETTVNANLIVPVEEGASASEFALGGVYPNPARGRVQIAYEVGAPTEVRMTLYDVLGRRVLTAHDGMTPAGAHTVTVDTGALAAGLYLLRVEADGASESRRLTVVR